MNIPKLQEKVRILKDQYKDQRLVRWPQELKLQIIEYFDTNAVTIKQLSKELDLACPLLYKWKNKYSRKTQSFKKETTQTSSFKKAKVVENTTQHTDNTTIQIENSTSLANLEVRLCSGTVLKGLCLSQIKTLIKESII